MDMDFLSDPIFSDLGRSDFVGGIDNEALDFGHFEQFMQVAAVVGSIDGSGASGHAYADHSEQQALCERKTNSDGAPHTPPTTTAAAASAPIATISARVSLTTATAPIATPCNGQSIAAGQQSSLQKTPQLPESPPDSSSEPPYSPLQDVHGLTLGHTRNLYGGLPSLQHDATDNGIHQSMHQTSSTQFTPPHHPQHPQQQPPPPPPLTSQSHFSHHLQSHLKAQQHRAAAADPANASTNTNTNTSTNTSLNPSSVGQVRVKHEAGLLINPSSLANPHGLHNPTDAHMDIGADPQQLLYPPAGATLLHYEGMSANLYTATSYQNISVIGGSTEQLATCMITSMSDASRVQVIGTSPPTPQLNRTSAPSTPIHACSSRKRKLSTQIDCPDFAHIKPDPGLTLSPVRTTPSLCHAAGGRATDNEHLVSATSPVCINLPNPLHDPSNTPTHSAASLSPALSTVHSNPEHSLDGSNNASGAGSGSNSGEPDDPNALTPCIRFSPFQPQNWHKLCDQNLQDLSVVYYRVDADKGFNFSISDDAFVCQKKNHFQITCHARLQGEAKFVKTPSGLEKIKSFHLHFYGVKLETPNQTIRVEQSQSDRSKKPFYPVPIDLQSHIVSKITVGRLHFSETTNNNMRKKGRPNPEQRYFQLVVGLHVHTMSGNFPVISQSSERIIVRASNPGQFESDVDLCWQRGMTQDSVYHMGRVGINTDRPDESFVVHGNLKVSGHIVQPSDSRAKQEIGELDTSVQLRNLQKIRIVRYRYEPQFAVHSGLKRASESDSEEIVDTGVIAQELREVIPDAVKEAGTIVLPNGTVIENFLLVNKDRILMENIGAVKELCKVTGSLETRIEHLERMNNRLIRAKEQDPLKGGRDHAGKEEAAVPEGYEMCSNRSLQLIIFILVIVMAACLAAVSTLYFIEHNRKSHNLKELENVQVLSNGHYFAQDSLLISERKFLHSNKTQWHWPNFHFLTTTTLPPPATATATATPQNTSHNVRQEINYSESGESYASPGRNDELAVVMEQPVVLEKPLQALKEPFRITTTAPQLRINKTAGSKNKSKWPLPHEVLRVATVQSAPLKGSPSRAFAPTDAKSSEIDAKSEDSGGIGESSSEKVVAADAIPLPQDFENNSIDIDAQHITKKTPLQSGLKATAPHRSTEPQHKALIVEPGDADITLKLTEHVVDPIASTSSSNILAVLGTTATANILKLNSGDSVIYKTVSPPTSHLAQTTNKVGLNGGAQIPYSGDSQPISNKSQGVLEGIINNNADSFDLQNLGSNNESADNPLAAILGLEFSGGVGGRESTLGRRSAARVDWVTHRTMQVDTFGTPIDCIQSTRRDDVTNCQSVCFEDSNQLPSQEVVNHRQQAVDVLDEADNNEEVDVAANVNVQDDEIEDEFADNHHSDLKATALMNAAPNDTKSVAADTVQALAKQASILEQQYEENADNLEAILEPSLSAEHLDHKPVPNVEASLSVEAFRAPEADCWQISSSLLADHLNRTFAPEDFCPNNGKSLNLTYIIPLSKYFKEPTIELHLSSSIPLQWTICQHEHKHLLIGPPTGHHAPHQSPQAHQPLASTRNILPRRHNNSILLLNIPSRGYFVRDVALRATDDLLQQNVCDAKAHESNALLQYNFRILRDCD